MGELAHRKGAETSGPDATPEGRAPESPRERAPGAPSRPSGSEWSGRITGLYLGKTSAEAVCGRSQSGRFHGDRWARAPIEEGDDLVSKLRELLRAGRIPSERIATFVPSSLLTTRYLRLPTRDAEEVRAMVPHQLALSLPVELERVAWNVQIVDAHEDGSSTVLVQIIRKDQLDTHLELVRELSPRVWAAIPEGQMLARVVARELEPSEIERTVLTWSSDTYHLLVEREGQLLYHRSFPANPEHWISDKALAVSEMLLLTIGEVQGARTDLAKLTERELPQPLHVLPALGRGGEVPGIEDFCERLAEQLAMRVVPVPPSEEAGAGHEVKSEVPLASSLAELGAFADVSILPREQVRTLNRREGRKTLLQTGAIVVGFLALGIVALFGNLRKEEARLGLLQAKVAEAQAQVDEIEGMRRALLAIEAASGSDRELFRVMASLERAMLSGIYLQKLSYSRGGRVEVDGSSPELAAVNELAKALESDRLWRSVRILRLQRPGRDPKASYQFAIEGLLESAGGTR